jgi:hypothetical protein
MESIFDPPMPTRQWQDPFWSSLAQRQIAQSIHHLEADLSCLEDGSRPFKTEDLLNALSSLAKPIIEIGTTRDAAVFQSSMAACPRFLLPPNADDLASDLQTDPQYRQPVWVGCP